MTEDEEWEKRILKFEKELRASGEEYYTDEETGHIYPFYKEHKKDKIWWVDLYNSDGGMLFSFDKKKVYSVFGGEPYDFTEEQEAIFIKENPMLASFFKSHARV